MLTIVVSTLSWHYWQCGNSVVKYYTYVFQLTVLFIRKLLSCSNINKNKIIVILLHGAPLRGFRNDKCVDLTFPR